MIVVACLLAPFYAPHIAHIGPNTNNVTGTINVGGKTTDVVSPDGVPIGPTFSSHYFFGADSNGRDLAVRLLYGGRTSLFIGGIATVIIILFGTLVGLLTGYFRGGHGHDPAAADGADLVLPAGDPRRGASAPRWRWAASARSRATRSTSRR